MDPVETIRIFLDAEQKRDWETVANLVHPDASYLVIGSESFLLGRQAIVEHMKSVYKELEDWQFEVVNMASNNDMVFVEFDGQGHWRGLGSGLEC